jgi:ribosomal protein L37AE/L43A
LSKTTVQIQSEDIWLKSNQGVSNESAERKSKKTILGKYEVTYDCPGCGQNLKNSLDDAGIQDHCPHCEAVFKVPGLSFKQKMEKEAADQAEAKRLAEEQKEAEKKAKAEAERHKKELAELAEEQEKKKAEKLRVAIKNSDGDKHDSVMKSPVTAFVYGVLALMTVVWGLEFFLGLSQVETVMQQAALGAMSSTKLISSYILARCFEKIIASTKRKDRE